MSEFSSIQCRRLIKQPLGYIKGFKGENIQGENSGVGDELPMV